MVAPWQTISSRTVLADRWINLRADDCRTGEGMPIAPYYVLTYPDFVNVVALTPDNHIVLVEQYRHGAGVSVLELPGGMMDPGDADPVAAAQRELREETGFAGATWQRVSSLYPNPATQTNLSHTVLAMGCHLAGNKALEAGEEGMQTRCLPVAEVVAGLRSGLLGQAMHVAGLLLALQVAKS
jgi:ADP-ribose pyrophosphatase YjhB (NUDIX family)